MKVVVATKVRFYVIVSTGTGAIFYAIQQSNRSELGLPGILLFHTLAN